MSSAAAAGTRGRERLAHAVDLTVVLVGRDLRASYGNALLGVVWAPLTALVQVAVLSFLFLRVVPLDVPDYPVFLFTGITAWQLLSTAISSGAEAFTRNRDLVARPRFPLVLLPVVSVGGALAGYLLSLPVLFAFLAAAGRLGLSVVWLPLVVLIMVVLTIGPALLAASWNVRFRDIRYMVGVGLGVAFYLTPVFYEVERIPTRYRWVADVNPLAAAVRLHRTVLYEGALPGLGPLVVSIATGLVLAAVGLAVFRRREAHLADDL